MKSTGLVPELAVIIFAATGLVAHAQSVPVESTSTNAVVVNLITNNSWWRLFDSGSEPVGPWLTLEYADAGWRLGPGQFGWGELDEATRLEPGVGSLMRCYFRHQFTVTNASAFTNLLFQVLCDDGAVVYLNGTEAFRMNMPTGVITVETFASSTVTGADENAYFQEYVDVRLLVNGTNIVAVELHQSSPTAADGSFDLALTAIGPPSVSPPSRPSPPRGLRIISSNDAAKR